MARRTAVPGVFVDQLEVETPPYDEPGVVQEYVGESLYQEYQTLQMPNEFAGQQVLDFIERAKEVLGVRGNKYRLIYHLKIKASATRFARSKARSFARIKNPFEPSMMNIRKVERSRDTIDEAIIDGPQKVYNVQVSVSK